MCGPEPEVDSENMAHVQHQAECRCRAVFDGFVRVGRGTLRCILDAEPAHEWHESHEADMHAHWRGR